ncbi:tryptophanyl-tRNA synthetase [Blastomyces dermatitidis ER-3]|uniref:Tryptophan--tRNA ligase, mitochondrial n=2 Tax=Ajellomyces dermatitidis TaxID=5039 RepID=F2TS38_AJEDA|nr:tryptophanyl-tRNA synthetase [Blastomyces dermatitidis ER-3]EEQ85861.1 tryptophanyl-tRNA synthetase [Blastomyces dermatitidis ER-3]EGE86051.2 tryptophanyl-tRNA synthetase [Blastomyces dermatitidis ATCC 18188]EQL32253.1 tryptophanyl-tRNA synthetase [Blastomyces dermatitidis ATCC 26199]
MSAIFQRAHPVYSVRNASRFLFRQLKPSRSLCPRQCRRNASATKCASTSNDRIIFSGIQPTGVPHLGNYLGALRQWVLLQNEAVPSTKLIFSIVDLHALTVPQDPTILRQWRKQLLATLIAVGINPKRSTIFFQSAVPAHSELMWILSTISSIGYLSRMTQWKSKLQLPEESTLDNSDAKSRLKLGLFSYPVLQAADVLVHRATDVPVGEDQKQHLEFTREIANGFNHIYGPVLVMPSPLISPAKRVMSLKQPTLKMSKSHIDPRSRILLTDSAEEIHQKIKLALTDSEPGISYDRSKRPGVSNLIEILSHVQGGAGGSMAFAELGREHQHLSMRAFKEHVANSLTEHLKGIREKYLELTSNTSSYIDTIAEDGAKFARRNADITLKSVKDTLGLS